VRQSNSVQQTGSVRQFLIVPTPTACRHELLAVAVDPPDHAVVKLSTRKIQSLINPARAVDTKSKLTR
jgi:hypothetical protein